MRNFLIQTIIIILLAGGALLGILYAAQNIFGFNLIPETIEELRANIPADIDNELKIQQYSKNLNTILATATARLSSNKAIELVDNNGYRIVYEEQDTDIYNYIVEILNLGIGENMRNIELKTKLDQEVQKQLNSEQLKLNRTTITYTITRDSFNLPFNMNTIERFEGAGFVFDGNNLAAKVSKSNSLSSDYEPEDLVDLNKDKLLYTNIAGIKLRAEAADALAIMLGELKRETGRDLVIASGYRSFDNQARTYAGWVRQFGLEGADRISARPGFSEHQLGTAVDFFDADSGFEFTNNFETTRAGVWLKENSYKYGFVQSYPSGQESLTGYSHEAWHFRYIGLDLAERYQRAGQTLNLFLESLTN